MCSKAVARGELLRVDALAHAQRIYAEPAGSACSSMRWMSPWLGFAGASAYGSPGNPELFLTAAVIGK